MTPGMLLLTAAALAQEQDPSLLKFGPLSIQPSIVFQNIGQDPNVFNSATDPQSDFTMTISPKVNVIFHVRKSKTTFTQTTDYVFSVGAEELGFIGAMVLFALFVLMLLRCLRIAGDEL